MVTTFLSSPFVMQIILPFIILFLVIYAVLQKSKILGGDNKLLNIAVSLAMALIAVSFASPINVITSIIPVFAIAIVSLLVLMIVFAFADGKDKFELNNGIKYAVWGAVGFAVVAMVIWSSGIWTIITKKTNTELLWNIIFFVIIAAVVAIAASGSGGEKKK
jgi:hypothetical protein